MTNHDPLDILKQEHQESLLRMGIVRKAAVSIRDNGFSAQSFQEIAEGIPYLGTVVRQHNEKEERFLFPLVDRHVMGATSEVRHERRDLWRAVNELTKFIREVEDGRVHSTTIRELIQAALFVVERFYSTVNRENNVLFPIVTRTLTPEEYEQLRAELAESAAGANN